MEQCNKNSELIEKMKNYSDRLEEQQNTIEKLQSQLTQKLLDVEAKNDELVELRDENQVLTSTINFQKEIIEKAKHENEQTNGLIQQVKEENLHLKEEGKNAIARLTLQVAER